MKKNFMLLQVLAAIVLSLFAGSLIGKEGILYRIVEVGGDLFLNALTLLVVPLIASSIISGIGQMHSEASFKSLGIKTFVFYILPIGIAFITNCVMPIRVEKRPFQTFKRTLCRGVSMRIKANPKRRLKKIIPSILPWAAAPMMLLGTSL